MQVNKKLFLSGGCNRHYDKQELATAASRAPYSSWTCSPEDNRATQDDRSQFLPQCSTERDPSYLGVLNYFINLICIIPYSHTIIYSVYNVTIIL